MVCAGHSRACGLSMGKGVVIMIAEPGVMDDSVNVGNGETTTVSVFLQMCRRPQVEAAVTQTAVVILRTKAKLVGVKPK